ncbi:signal peptidase I [candidate division WOR-1 bacterium RIFOXYB2_FULL_48_7]|uniref:Signal peptidase I n=1 Tax=candidate division WOR-1 bacterium RIFOXYB2_FULL_48_7 TaxID=1802583 RepID=A0A1F4TF70_UNCSA|nr:MAG: signal peptidase I [candidate division WOR-1 bacterium RIFOXYB2_FULL_48_7]
MKAPRLNHPIFDWAETIVVALVLALIIRAFFLQVFWIPSPSMVPTLEIGDRVVADKITYHFRQPQRQEVVIFREVKPPELPALLQANKIEKRDLIKRLVALPGDKLQIIEGEIFVNGRQQIEKHPMNKDDADYGPIIIPEDAYFVMGDNRGESYDSRYWGFLPKKNLIGRALFVIWPLNKFGIIP